MMKWRVDGQFDSDTSIDVVDEGDFIVCEVAPFDGDWTPDDIHRACLIAAAPELFDALVEAYGLMPLGTKKRSDWVEKVSALLARARGERSDQAEAQPDSGVAKQK